MRRLSIAAACAFVLVAVAAGRSTDAEQSYVTRRPPDLGPVEPAVSPAADLVTEGQRHDLVEYLKSL